MRKSADVVILMKINAESYKLLYPKTIDWDAFETLRPDVPFSDEIIEYLNALSSALMKDRESRLYPDVITFGFFCRIKPLRFYRGHFVPAFLFWIISKIR